MPSVARLVVRQDSLIRSGLCAVCGRPYESVGRGHLLCDGDRTWGHVCLWCAEGGPRRAARRLRQRAARLRRLRERCRVCLRAWGWTGLHQLLADCAAHLDDLAGRVEQSGAWKGLG